jgi:hypothetical protein
LAVLGASVQVVAGVTVGGVTLGVPAELGDDVRGVLARYGLSADLAGHSLRARALEGVA